MQNKLFKPNFNKKRYTITIDVFENCCSLKLSPGENKDVNYHEIIGVLETQKHHLMTLQREENIKLFKKKRTKL